VITPTEQERKISLNIKYEYIVEAPFRKISNRLFTVNLVMMKIPLYATAGVATSCVAFLFGYVRHPYHGDI
jgi:hypothetical protein